MGWDMCYLWERREMHSGSGLDSLKKRDRLADLGVDGKIILKVFLNRMVTCGLNKLGSRVGQVTRSGQNCNKHSGNIK
jgi:hypothetical protein